MGTNRMLGLSVCFQSVFTNPRTRHGQNSNREMKKPGNARAFLKSFVAQSALNRQSLHCRQAVTLDHHSVQTV